MGATASSEATSRGTCCSLACCGQSQAVSRVALDGSDTTLWPAPPPAAQPPDAVSIPDNVATPERLYDAAALGKIRRRDDDEQQPEDAPPPPERPEAEAGRSERSDAAASEQAGPSDEHPGAPPEVVGARISVRSSKGSARTSVVSVTHDGGRDDGKHVLRVATGKPYPKRPMVCKLGKVVWQKLEELFRAMDIDSSNAITKEEAELFFKGAFGNVSAEAMFNEVDVDGSGAITAEEFAKFWTQVRGSGYSDQDILEEVEQLLEGGSWVDWKDGRDTTQSGVRFPKRPILCKLSAKVWKSSEELFKKIDRDGKLTISKDEANAFFQGAFANVSTDAMFKEVDTNNHGLVTAADWMQFWTQVKASGYKEKDILEEQEQIMAGGAWVDWNDGRCTA